MFNKYKNISYKDRFVLLSVVTIINIRILFFFIIEHKPGDYDH